MKTFKPSTIMAALLSSGVALYTHPALAQTAPDAPTDEIERPQEDTVERIEVRGFSSTIYLVAIWQQLEIILFLTPDI